MTPSSSNPRPIARRWHLNPPVPAAVLCPRCRGKLLLTTRGKSAIPHLIECTACDYKVCLLNLKRDLDQRACENT